MSDSLHDQLKALGLGKPKAQAKPKKKRQEFSLEKAYALKKRDEQKQTDHARKKKAAEDRQRRLLNNEIRKIIKAHRLNNDNAEIARNFMFRGRIRKIHVTPEQLTALNAGELGIAYLSGGYHLLAKEHVKAVRCLSSEHVPNFSSETEDDGDHPVPDDLDW